MTYGCELPQERLLQYIHFNRYHNTMMINKLREEMRHITRGFSCEAPWTHLAGGCYRFLTEKLSWDGAKEACERLPGGGRLVEIRTEEQNDAIYEEAKKLMPTAWIGLSDRAREGEWVWTSGETATFTNWARMPGQEPMPDNYRGIDKNGENCAVINTDPNAKNNWEVPQKWNDVSCLVGGATGAICSKSHN